MQSGNCLFLHIGQWAGREVALALSAMMIYAFTSLSPTVHGSAYKALVCRSDLQSSSSKVTPFFPPSLPSPHFAPEG